MKKIAESLKHFFIPHKNNEYKPYFFREYFVGILCVFVLVIFSFSFGSKFYIKNTNMTAAVLPAVLVDLTNKDRIDSGINPLVRNPALDEAARLKAEDMANKQYFAHNSPDGTTPWQFMNKAGYRFYYAGENLAVDFTESVDVESAWLASPKHKANIMDARFTEIGIAAVDAVFEGKPTTFVVQMFGRPIEKNTKILAIKDLSTEDVSTKSEDSKKIELVPEVKGESIGSIENIKVLEESDEFISVKNTDIKEDLSHFNIGGTNIVPEKNSSFLDRIIFSSPNTVDVIYRILIYIVLIALFMLMFIEIKRQHPKNILYGVGLLILIVFLSYINRAVFVSTLLF